MNCFYENPSPGIFHITNITLLPVTCVRILI
nr:MAG TPA: hypothetical protein [Caudoviricetes sp.]